MGVLSDKLEGREYIYPPTKIENCFYCSRPPADPMMYWQGSHELFLHPGCFIQLTTRLMRDFHQLEYDAPESLGLTLYGRY